MRFRSGGEVVDRVFVPAMRRSPEKRYFTSSAEAHQAFAAEVVLCRGHAFVQERAKR